MSVKNTRYTVFDPFLTIFASEPDQVVFGGDGLRKLVLRRLLAADASLPGRRAVVAAYLSLQLRLHTGGGRCRIQRRHKPTGMALHNRACLNTNNNSPSNFSHHHFKF